MPKIFVIIVLLGAIYSYAKLESSLSSDISIPCI